MPENFSFLLDNDEEKKDIKRDRMETKSKYTTSELPLLKEYAFLSPKRIKYLITIQSKMNIAGVSSENTVEIRWYFTLKEIIPSGYVFELLMLDNTMIHTNNDGFSEVHKMVSQMQKALNEVEFQTNKQGVVSQVLNIEAIKQKWKSVKAEMFEYNKNMTSIQDLCKVNEKNFEEKGGVEKMVNDIEFFNLCINHLYGKKMPFYIKKTLPNFFRSSDFIFEIDYENQRNAPHSNHICFTGTPILSKKDIEKAYGAFSFINMNILNPKITYKGDYLINIKDGFLENGEIIYKEIIEERLSAEITYKIKRYE